MEPIILIPDLFPEETAKAKAEREAKVRAEAENKKPRGVYHDRNGKFTDRATAEKAALEKENYRLKRNYNYYKRVNKRLSDEIKEATQRANQWENKYKSLLMHEKDTQHQTIPCTRKSAHNGQLPR